MHQNRLLFCAAGEEGVCTGVCAHLSREDGCGRVRHRPGVQGESAGGLHLASQGECPQALHTTDAVQKYMAYRLWTPLLWGLGFRVVGLVRALVGRLVRGVEGGVKEIAYTVQSPLHAGALQSEVQRAERGV